jgi:hypothetical protein
MEYWSNDETGCRCASPLASSPRFVSATACTEPRWVRTARRSRSASLACPGSSASTLAPMLPL